MPAAEYPYMSGYLAIGFRSNKVGDKADVTHPQPLPATAALALKSLADFWADMGLEEARALNIPRAAAQRPAAGTRPATPARQMERPPSSPVTGARPEPRRINNNPIADARKLAASANSMAELRAIIDQFDGCPLKKAAKNTVVCDGAYDADVMIVGEAPGGEEDAQGLPFVGRAGKLLDKMLATIGLSRQENVFITNLIYWRPPGNRDPSPAEMQICAPFLSRQIELKKPKLLLTAGKFATQASCACVAASCCIARKACPRRSNACRCFTRPICCDAPKTRQRRGMTCAPLQRCAMRWGSSVARRFSSKGEP